MKFLSSLRPGIVGLGLGLVLAACSRQAVPPEPIRAVKLLQVQAHAAQASRSFAAEVRAQTEARLGFRVAGKLLQRPAQLGQAVSAGQLLAQLDAQDYALGAQAAQAQVQAAQTQRDLAQADWQRFSALQAQGFISPVELDRRRAQLEAARRCEQCGAALPRAARRSARFCSPRCRQRASRARSGAGECS